MGCDVADRARPAAAQRAGGGPRRLVLRGGRADRAHRRAHDTQSLTFGVSQVTLQFTANVRVFAANLQEGPGKFAAKNQVVSAQSPHNSGQLCSMTGGCRNVTLTPSFEGGDVL